MEGSKRKCFSTFVLALMTVCGISKAQPLQSCLVREDPFSSTTVDDALGITFYLDLNNPFICYGVIEQWKFCYKSSPGSIFDTLYIGVYKPDADGDRFIRQGSNGIYLNLENDDCITVDADPQLVVDEGYVIGFYAALTYIKFYDNPMSGYLYKSVAFPSSISKGVLIKTTHSYSPKLEALIIVLGPGPGESSVLPQITSSLSPTSSPTAGPLPGNTTGIPAPDLDSGQCLLGIAEGFVHSYQLVTTVYINKDTPSVCKGHVVRWEICYHFINESSTVKIGIWRPNASSYYPVIQQDVLLAPLDTHHANLLVCSVANSTIAESVWPGDFLGFSSMDIHIAFGSQVEEASQSLATISNSIPLFRAILEVEETHTTTSILLPPPTFITSSTSPSAMSPSPSAMTTSQPIPPHHSTSIDVIIGGIIGGLVAVLCILMVILGIMLNTSKPKRRLCSSLRTFSVYENDMMYNVNYVPCNQEEIIIHGHRKWTLDLKSNPSYSKPETQDQDKKDLEHTYESI